MKRIFFYGLFMDDTLLRQKGLHPMVIGPAALPGYQILIGNRATLVANPEATAYGMLIDLPDEDATVLYSAPDVRDYVGEQVDAILAGDRAPKASLCYNLPASRLGGEMNTAYAEQLADLVLRLGFPPDYADAIREGGAN